MARVAHTRKLARDSWTISVGGVNDGEWDGEGPPDTGFIDGGPQQEREGSNAPAGQRPIYCHDCCSSYVIIARGALATPRSCKTAIRQSPESLNLMINTLKTFFPSVKNISDP
ncbi:unnamed protein product [Dovyalis caffra]|uniref:Uncharacterized protein n=1 Tax=Dovyalis caffra TaxID=77055 RepID=A0AAV1S7X9_9ROSI|nr:unnamed protein product [Dovyalis caffra]